MANYFLNNVFSINPEIFTNHLQCTSLICIIIHACLHIRLGNIIQASQEACPNLHKVSGYMKPTTYVWKLLFSELDI